MDFVLQLCCVSTCYSGWTLPVSLWGEEGNWMHLNVTAEAFQSAGSGGEDNHKFWRDGPLFGPRHLTGDGSTGFFGGLCLRSFGSGPTRCQGTRPDSGVVHLRRPPAVPGAISHSFCVSLSSPTTTLSAKSGRRRRRVNLCQTNETKPTHSIPLGNRVWPKRRELISERR